VIAHDVATTDGGETDGGRVTLAGVAVALVHGTLFQIAANRLGNHLTHLERGATGRIHLVAVVRFDDLDVVAGGQGLRGHLQQLERDVHTHAHVGRHDDGDVFGDLGDLGFLVFRKTGGADHGLHAQFAANLQVGHRAFRTGEVDQEFRILEASAQVAGDGHARGLTKPGCSVLTQRRAGGDVEGTSQTAVIGGQDGFDQHVPHAAGGACHSDGQGIVRRRSGHVGFTEKTGTAISPQRGADSSGG